MKEVAKLNYDMYKVKITEIQYDVESMHYELEFELYQADMVVMLCQGMLYVPEDEMNNRDKVKESVVQTYYEALEIASQTDIQEGEVF